MAEIIDDVFNALEDFFVARFGGSIPVKLAFKDERVENEDNRIYPSITITMFDATSATASKYSGMTRIRTDDIPEGTTEIKKPPIPIALYFQLDTFAEKVADDRNIQEILMPLLGGNDVVVTTEGGRKLPLATPGFENLDTIEGNIWRKAYTFYTVVWFPHWDDAQTEYLVLEIHFDINAEQFIPESV